MTIDELFLNPIDCCGLYASDEQQLIAEYYIQAMPCMSKILDKIYSSEIFGKDTELLYNNLNDFNYLLGLMLIIYNKRINNLLLNEDDLGAKYYYTKYNLECIRKTFMCKGCDIIKLLRVFNLDPDYQNDQDGIGYMHLENAPLNHHKFIIH